MTNLQAKSVYGFLVHFTVPPNMLDSHSVARHTDDTRGMIAQPGNALLPTANRYPSGPPEVFLRMRTWLSCRDAHSKMFVSGKIRPHSDPIEHRKHLKSLSVTDSQKNELFINCVDNYIESKEKYPFGQRFV